ncbi:hypothetical protein ES695_05075 [Candidatus Atribacteria bacterium 1244-E10-H5-B2]|nr:MAG: hypothetical protein ES695_05075 [Candidatus Atribacteria bacterium 1244-E10-H5-B2]
MILKLRTQRILKAITWRLLDDIKEINYGRIDEPKWLKGKTMTPYQGKISGIPDYINTYPEALHKIITQLDIYYKNGDTETIFTDNEVYIMDDSGKTIDTIPCKLK